MKLYDNFPNSYFDGSSQMKKEFAKELMSSLNPDQLLSKAHNEMESLIASAGLSSFSMDFCKACFLKAPNEFFILPTATTGKYHGGRTSPENSIGGNIVHTSKVLAIVPKILNRYKGLINTYTDIPERLKVSCILHDICKVSSGNIYTSELHGEDGAHLINYVWSTFDPENMPPVDYIKSITYAVANHMYLWKFENVWNQISANLDASALISDLLVGLMLAECDYYSF